MRKPRRIVSGHLESFSLSEIAQTVSLGRKTACLTLRGDGRQGRIWFEKGAAKHAECGTLSGEVAFFEMVGWSTCGFTIESDRRTKKRSLDQDVMFLVMEGLRRLDEAGGKARHLPDASRRPAWFLAVEIALLLLGLASLLIIDLQRSRGMLAVAGLGLAGMPQLVGPPAVPAPPASQPSEELSGVVKASEAAVAEPEPAETVVAAAADDAEEWRESESDEEPDPAAGATEGLDRITGAAAAGPGEPPGGVAAPATFEAAAYLEILGRSRIKTGHLTVLVDGSEVYSRPLASDRKRRFFRRAPDTFETIIEVTPGEHQVVARVRLDEQEEDHENSLMLEFEPGATQQVTLMAGRSAKRPLSLKAE